MKIRRRNFRKDTESHNFWPSFTDVMATIALVLFFLMLLAYIQYIIAGKNLEAAGKNLDFLQRQLEDTEDKLESSNLEISNAENQLRLLQQDIEHTMAELEQGEILLKLSQERISEQEKIIANSNQELEKLRAKLQNIAVLRVEVLSRVKSSIEAQIGSTTADGQPLVTIGENANLVLNESLLFELGRADISYEGRILLGQLANAFENILDDPETREFIDTIHIEGHTCDIGTPSQNMKLSSERAYEVVNHIMKENPDLITKDYARFFAASGYSEHRPIAPNADSTRSLNRRIEISITLKDSHVRGIIDEYLDSN